MSCVKLLTNVLRVRVLMFLLLTVGLGAYVVVVFCACVCVPIHNSLSSFVGIASSYSSECVFLCGKPAGVARLPVRRDVQLHPASHGPSARTRIRRDDHGIRPAEYLRRTQQLGHRLRLGCMCGGQLEYVTQRVSNVAV